VAPFSGRVISCHIQIWPQHDDGVRSIGHSDRENTLDNVFKILFKILPLKCI